MFDWLFGHSAEDHSPEGLDDRVYQRQNGTMYIKSGEFARSEEGQRLLERFNKMISVQEKRTK